MAFATYPIKGVPSQSEAPLSLRQEITAWYNDDTNKYQVSLFMQAMTIFQKMAITERTSYFQIAGIHSYPLVGWDGETPAPPPQGTDPPGYCSHNKITFPTWHRPYMLLFEQVLYYIMEDLIKSWTTISSEERFVWERAASSFRLPYWDWARLQPYTSNYGLPQVCTVDTVSIAMPGGDTKHDFPNPLIKFTNPTNVPMGDESMKANAIQDDKDVPKGWQPLPWSKCIGTSRYGIFSDQPPSVWENGVNNYKAADQAIQRPPWYLRGARNTFSDAVSRMLSKNYLTSWSTFSSTIHNNAAKGGNTNYLSLEYIHNIVHNATGGLFMNAKERGKSRQDIGLGHMGDVPVAAFDPIFWLHHCNIDRLTAIWQTLNWEAWFDNSQDGDPKPGDALHPFHTDEVGSLWNSNTCREWWQYNYQYDDLADLTQNLNPDGSPTSEYIDQLREKINELYPGTSRTIKENAPGYTLEDDTFNDYIINVVYDRYALDGRAYAILFFYGDIPDTLDGYRQQQSYLGQVYTFSAPIQVDGATACGNCQQQKSQKILSKAQVPITLPLLSLVSQSSHEGSDGTPLTALGVPQTVIGPLKPGPLKDILKDGLKWIFVEIGGEIVSEDHFPDTEIKVLHGTAKHAASTTASPEYNYSGYKVLKDTTKHLPLGFTGGSGLHLIHDDP